MAKWVGKHDATALADDLRRRLGASPNVPRGALGEKRMFGGVCFLLRNNMLCGAGKNGYMFRTDPTRAAAAAALPGGAPVIMQGRPMKGFSWVDPDAWVRRDSGAGSRSPKSMSAQCRPRRRRSRAVRRAPTRGGSWTLK
jgi:hypothetical protein